MRSSVCPGMTRTHCYADLLRSARGRSHPSRRRTWFASVGLVSSVCSASLVVPTVASSQEVRRQVLEPDATTPAAFVSLVVRDSAGVVIARSQTTSSGRFSVQLGGGGTFRLRALRIGYLPTDTSFSTARADDVVTLRLILSMRRVVLAPVTVAERNRCADASAGNGALVGIWEQVSATLDATSRSDADEALAVETISYTASQRSRDRAPSALAVESPTWRRGGSFQSAEARDLVEHGFLRIREGELEFLAPDARVLIDSAFIRG